MDKSCISPALIVHSSSPSITVRSRKKVRFSSSHDCTASRTASLDVLHPPVAEAEAANGGGVFARQAVVVPLRRLEREARVVKARHELVDGVADGGKPDWVLGSAAAHAAKVLRNKSFKSIFVMISRATLPHPPLGRSLSPGSHKQQIQ